MATNNNINLNLSGLAKYNGSGTFSIATGVSDGLTGATSFTAYGALCGGTSSTNPIQSVSPGNSGQALLSNGASTLPAFQYPGPFSVIQQISASQIDPADSTTYYLANNGSFQAPPNNNSLAYRFITNYCTITAAYGLFVINGTLASSENNTVSIRVNGSSVTDISTTIQLTVNPTTFNNTGLSISLVPGDYIEIRWVAPAYATNPTSVGCTVGLVVT
jgi:hypothetical protein